MTPTPPGQARAHTQTPLSARALSTPEPLVRAFARRVQQEGALDLTQGDYKNADFAPHPEVVRAAQRITRNTVHSYGPAVGRMDVRSEIAEFFNRDGRIDYPSSEVRFLPDEVLFTPGTRSGLAMVLEVLGADGSGVVVPRPSWEYDWFVERAGKRLVELPTSPPEFLPDPGGAGSAAGAGRHLVGHPQQPAQPHGPRLSAVAGRIARRRVRASRRLCPLRLGLPAARLRGGVRQPGVRQPRVAGVGRHDVGPVQDGHVRRLHGRAGVLARDVRSDPVRAASARARSSPTSRRGSSRRRPRSPRTGRSPRSRARWPPSGSRRRTCGSAATSWRRPRTPSRRWAWSARTSAARSTRRWPSRA